MENLEEGKMLCMSWGIFFFKIKLLWHFLRWKALRSFFLDSLFSFANSFTRLSWWSRWIERARLSTPIQPCVHTAFLFSPCHSQRHIILRFRRWIFSRNYYTNKKKIFQCDKNTRETLFVEWSSKKVFLFRFFQPRPFLSADNEHEFAIVLTRRELILDYENKLTIFFFPFPHSKFGEVKRKIYERKYWINFLYTTDFFLSCDSLNTRELLNWRIERTDGLAAAKTFFDSLFLVLCNEHMHRTAVWLCKKTWL